MAIDGVAKGKRAEREVAGMLRAAVVEAFGEGSEECLSFVIERNLAQARAGGYDVVGIPWLAVEVKHHKTAANVEVWWKQCVRQAGDGQLPVLFYKGDADRKGWRVRTVLSVTCSQVAGSVYMVGDVTADAFMRYVVRRLRIGASGESVVSE